MCKNRIDQGPPGVPRTRMHDHASSLEHALRVCVCVLYGEWWLLMQAKANGPTMQALKCSHAISPSALDHCLAWYSAAATKTTPANAQVIHTGAMRTLLTTSTCSSSYTMSSGIAWRTVVCKATTTPTLCFYTWCSFSILLYSIVFCIPQGGPAAGGAEGAWPLPRRPA